MTMYDVYVSCSSDNLQMTAVILHGLEDRGLSCRMSAIYCQEDGSPDKETRQAIDNSGAVIAVITEMAMDSASFLEELRFAVRAGKPVIPLIWDDCRLTTELRFLTGGEQPLVGNRMEPDTLVQQLILRIRMHSTRMPEPPAQKFNLKLIREKQFFVVDVAIKAMTEDGTEHRLKNGEDVTLSVSPGRQTIQFTGSFRKTKVELDVIRDTALLLKWNRVTGHIDVESISGTNLKILQKK